MLVVAALVVSIGGLVLLVGRDDDRVVVPAAVLDVRSVSGWYRLDLPAVEVVSGATEPLQPRDRVERYFVWADLSTDPVRAMSAYFATEGAPTEFGPGEATEIDDVPWGRAWVLDSVADGDNLNRLQWTRVGGSVVIVTGTGVDTAQLTEWMFSVGSHPSLPPAAPDAALELQSFDYARTAPGYSETWRLDGHELSANAWPDGLSTLLGLGFSHVGRITVDGIAGHVFSVGAGDGQTQVVTWPLDGGYWAVVTVRGELNVRFDEIVDHLVMLPT